MVQKWSERFKERGHSDEIISSKKHDTLSNLLTVSRLANKLMISTNQLKSFYRDKGGVKSIIEDFKNGGIEKIKETQTDHTQQNNSKKAKTETEIDKLTRLIKDLGNREQTIVDGRFVDMVNDQNKQSNQSISLQ
ncbi:MAG: DNA-directed RNA polymerase specialized sigma subunit [Myxococcota bacterium]|jgi:DNA-directed RNA polymerase specialized sigma subunit